jgi:peptide/nickel transport system substrate-binding protein
MKVSPRLLWLAVLIGAVVVMAFAFELSRSERSRSATIAAPARVDVPVGDRRGALVDQVVFTQEADLGKVSALIESGSLQVFAQGISNATVFRRLRDSKGVDYEIAYGTSAELTFNPAGARFEDGRINPFHQPEVREAFNWLIDRRYVAEELYGGLAVPRYLPINTAFPDYARLAEVARTLEIRYAHDPERARRVIHEQMEKLGASLQQGRWMHNGAPVRISVLIRTDDERRRVGDYVANLLEGQGFEVERMYRTPEEASRIWIAGDPRAGRWHIYTGAWLSTVINRDLVDNLSYYYTRRGRPEPLWQAYTPDPELDKIAERLERRDYATWAERQKLFARGIELAMKDSARVWLVDQLNVLPRAANVSLATDLAAGIAGSALWPYTLRYRDRLGGSVVIGLPGLLTEPWNPVAGSNWVFDTMIMRGLSDTELLPDPFTGLFWPQRIDAAQVTVQKDVPVIRTHDWLTVEKVAKITVPADAWIDWDAAGQRFITTGEKYPKGITARTRVRVRYEPNYLERRWHDGSKISLADMVLPWIVSFERADKQSALYDAAHVAPFEVFRRHFRGWRILSRAPLEIEIYSDQIYPDAEWIVNARVPSVSPWHTLALGIRAERQGELAFSSNKADRARVDWMSLIAGPSLAILERHLQAARDEGFLPYANVLGQFVRKDEVAERYRALTQWYAQRRHFWVDNGPFYLHSVHPVERSVVIRRYEDFPDRADKWLRFARARIPVLDLDGPLIVSAQEAADFTLRISFDDAPYPADAIEGARYLFFDRQGRLITEGDAVPTGNGRWKIALSREQIAKLGVGANSLEVAVTSVHVALPAFATHAFAIVPGARKP